MPITMPAVRNAFERYGWKCKEVGPQALISGWHNDDYDFELLTRFDDTWVNLSVNNFVPPVPAASQAEVNAKLLGLNARMVFCRFALSPEGKVLLVADIPGRTMLDYDVFAVAIDVLTYFAEDTYSQLYEMVTGEKPAARETAIQGGDTGER